MTDIEVATERREQMLDVTAKVQEAVSAAGIGEGVAQVFCLHTTAGLSINENADPDVATDILLGLRALVPEAGPWRHGEGNSDAHLKATMVGSSVSVPVSRGKLHLGTWQAIYLCEFDGPRHRRIAVTVVPGQER